MRACPNCGWLVPDGAVVDCPRCGARMPGAVPNQAPSWPPTAPAQYGAPTEYDEHAAPSRPLYPPTSAPGYPSGAGESYGSYGSYGSYPRQPAAPSQPLYPGATYGQPAPPSVPMYPYGAYPPQPAPPSVPMYPYNAPPSQYSQAPGVNWRPAQPKSGMPVWLIVTLVVALVAVIATGVGYGAYALTAHRGGAAPLTANPNATATASSSGVLLSDPLTSNQNGWAEDSHCFFDPNGYHIVSPANEGILCYASIGAITDGRITVTAEQLAGSTHYPYGITFRFNASRTHYFFAIDSNSKWVLFRVTNDKFTRLKDYTFNASIHGGLHKSNTLTVEFLGQQITCSVNGVKVGVVTDSGASLGAGKVALEALDGANMVFTNFVAEQ